jgi:hypothetical protein
MIKFTGIDGKPIWINPRYIVSMRRLSAGSDQYTLLIVPEDERWGPQISVKETPEEIAG